MSAYSYTTLYDGSERPDGSGPVTILYETVNPGTARQLSRPIQAYGLIVPTETTGRKSAPEPASGFRVGMTKTLPKKATTAHVFNTGSADRDKGHIIALELGGPDVAHNICPQYSQFQRNGEWRRMEIDALAQAESAAGRGAMVHMDVQIFYATTQSYKRSLVPARFGVTLRAGSVTGDVLKSYRIENAQDATDDRMLFRITDPLDAVTTSAAGPSRPSLGPPLSQPGVPQAWARRQSRLLEAGAPGDGDSEGGAAMDLSED